MAKIEVEYFTKDYGSGRGVFDIEMQQTFIEFIKEAKARGKTILLSSHIFSEVDATCDKV